MSDLLGDHPQLLEVHKAVNTGVIAWEENTRVAVSLESSVIAVKEINYSYFVRFLSLSRRIKCLSFILKSYIGSLESFFPHLYN